LERPKRAGFAETIEVRGVGRTDGVEMVVIAESPAVEYDECASHA
jgi:ribosomal protein L19